VCRALKSLRTTALLSSLSRFVYLFDLTNHVIEVAGFGQNENGSSSNQKMKVGVTESSQDYCQNLYKRLGNHITSKQVQKLHFLVY